MKNGQMESSAEITLPIELKVLGLLLREDEQDGLLFMQVDLQLSSPFHGNFDGHNM